MLWMCDHTPGIELSLGITTFMVITFITKFAERIMSTVESKHMTIHGGWGEKRLDVLSTWPMPLRHLCLFPQPSFNLQYVVILPFTAGNIHPAAIYFPGGFHNLVSTPRTFHGRDSLTLRTAAAVLSSCAAHKRTSGAPVQGISTRTRACETFIREKVKLSLCLTAQAMKTYAKWRYSSNYS